MMETILIADDEKNIRNGLAQFISAEGYEAIVAADGEEALRHARARDIACALIDLRMPKIRGDALLKTLISEQPSLVVIMISGHGTVENAVRAMHDGAYDFVTKPINLDRLSALLKRALQNRETLRQNEALLEELRARVNPSINSQNQTMREIIKSVVQAARTHATVLITGESGVGKELVADLVHARSPRYGLPLIKVHCASLSESLLESELFGHEKGAFTGATAQRKGRFELAHKGSMFLDEIGEISLTMQVKILRVLQEKKFERVGGEKTITVDVRIIAATNRNLEAEIAKGHFREDLYYRLNVVHVEMPPLRERREDIPALITRFLREASALHGIEAKSLSQRAYDLLLQYSWPGNIRELKNCIESALIISEKNTIDIADLPRAVAGSHAVNRSDGAPPSESSLEEIERAAVEEALRVTHGNKTKSAALLGIQRSTLYYKMRKYNLH